MKWILRAFLAGILLLSASGFSRAGGLRVPDGDPWEVLLDRYESICLQCLDLRNRKDGGQSVSARQLQGLLEELEQLRDRIRGATDKMPPAARYRYEAIRRMYASGVPVDTHPPRMEAFTHPFRLPGVQVPETPSWQPSPPPVTPAPVYLRPVWVLSVSAVVLPEQAYGVRAARLGRRWGGYAAFHSNFAHHPTAYDATSDGASGDARIWTSGSSAKDLLLITGGPALRVGAHGAVFAGLGYGFRRLCWEDSEGQWIRITDASPCGVCTELGASFLYRRFALSASWLSLPPSFGALAVSVGVAF